MKLNKLLLGILLVVIVIGCTPAPQPPHADETGATPEGVSAVANANNQFAFDMYQAIAEGGDNLFFSPWSISAAMAMTYEGARGTTAEEMKNVFYFSDDEARRPAYAALHNKLYGAGEYELYTANALWPDKNFGFLEEYINTVQKYYASELNPVDFVSATEEARITINNWVEEKTKDKIKDILPPGSITHDTRLVLTNAIYFKGTWVKQFKKGDTRNEPFHAPDGDVDVPMMRLTGDKAEFKYMENEELQMIELPYDGEDLSMLVLLPREDITALEMVLDAEHLEVWKGDMFEQQIDVYLPKFKLETKYFMADTLSAMGMPTAFSMDADFSGMDGSTDLFISSVIHQAYVDVNEEGTEAAAATAIIMTLKGMPNMFRADKPFIFLIQENETGNILFLGRVMNPS